MALTETDTPAPVNIRYATPDDTQTLVSVLGLDVPIPAAVSEEVSQDPRDRVWLAECADGSGVVGLVGLRMIQTHSGEIHDLWVAPEHRGRGVGVQLMEACLGYCRDHGVIKTLLHAEENQTAAIHLFKKVGFLLARSKEIQGGSRLEFYQDLYHEDTNA